MAEWEVATLMWAATEFHKFQYKEHEVWRIEQGKTKSYYLLFELDTSSLLQ